MNDVELKQLIASNAKAIQAAADERVEMRQAILRLEQVVLNLEQATLKLTDIQGGMATLLSHLDEDRPTILRKLSTIENKVDRLLEQQNRDQ